MKDILNTGKAKALAIYGALGVVLGVTLAISPIAGGVAIGTVAAGHWFLLQIVQRRYPKPDPSEGPNEQLHVLANLFGELARHDPTYADKAMYLRLADEDEASLPPKPGV
ncbi:hypothetical protein [Streptomyces monashensis]|uniref:Uncharacterized protein n=1 Tax=Streptomyces monashensis TaxID=1678012 RepID=A0A1S2QRL6_9ACTN|nr:hypothetical protein [Streptomyces monashensis]OIK08203.1 hypothetical protein BIV23_00195 [Streptomyces monashensis]